MNKAHREPFTASLMSSVQSVWNDLLPEMLLVPKDTETRHSKGIRTSGEFRIQRSMLTPSPPTREYFVSLVPDRSIILIFQLQIIPNQIRI